ncbi:growth-regulating factor 7-like [Arachis stenosperma]|uniref:growth-regulating factor 7-like n=1 Tax=Arachis stenosperma TaxID=217475 RepID=UPI0025AC5294|nr:growth-regulating factor 7-like [Arachis stenosperma]
MDLGVVGFDGLVGSEAGFVPFGSGFLKHQRSEEEVSNNDHNNRRGAKLSKVNITSGDDDDDVITTTSKGMLFFQNHQRNNNNSSCCNVLLRSNNNNNNNNNNGNDNVAIALFKQEGEEKMLSFSTTPTPKSETLIVEKASSNATLHTSYHPFSSYNINNNAGYNNSNWGMMMMGNNSSNNNVGRVVGAALFTPSQWMELEHQALIYKYITANVPVPSHLLIPITKALHSTSPFSNFPNPLLRPNTLGWGGFHLGFSSSTDPEPGRCRRTDGKKWRCSRDAVVDQKYCERHMNRGRHRSRKPVEGQSGHAAAVTTTTTTTTTTSNSKLLLPNNNNSSSSFSIVGNTASNNNSNTISFGNCHEHKNVIQQQQPVASDASAANNISRMFMKKENNNANESCSLLPMLPPKENPFMIHNNHHEFGVVTCDSLLNPSSNNKSNDSQNNSLRQFIDESTQLSISIPNHQFMPTNEKVTLSPLRVSSSRELELELVDPIQMGLGVGIGVNNNNNNIVRQPNWIPISWESSMGGPLGEVLNLNNNNNNNNNKGSLNLISSDGWDNSPSIGSSPTGVLQKTTAFGSLSNSSAGSSPRAADNNKGGAIL